jgi:hypothetical protein
LAKQPDKLAERPNNLLQKSAIYVTLMTIELTGDFGWLWNESKPIPSIVD